MLNLPNHPVSAFADIRQVDVPWPDVEGLPADQLGSGSGNRAAAAGNSRATHRSCCCRRHRWGEIIINKLHGARAHTHTLKPPVLIQQSPKIFPRMYSEFERATLPQSFKKGGGKKNCCKGGGGEKVYNARVCV